MIIAEKIQAKFVDLFKEEPKIIRSPGRVNLIGEHTDYNMGYVLPAAIDKSIYLGISKRNDNKCKFFAFDLNDSFECSLENIEKSDKQWPNYLLGVFDQLKKTGYTFNGFNCVFGGDIPIGAGLSSSAAIEAGLAFALNYIFKLEIDNLSLVKIAQRAENEFVGVKCGIMDQYVNIFGKNGHVLRIDCRSLEKDYFPFNYENISIVLFDTNVSHSLASSEYNLRRQECNDGVNIIKRKYPEILSLRDVSLELLNEFKSKMNNIVYKRCRYVIEENQRLLKACDVLYENDLKKFGSYMYKSHEGLSRDYEVSCSELDFLVDLVKDIPDVYGARMMGGGFGGCTINLIENESIDEISQKVIKEYKKNFGVDANVYITKINSGTNLIET
jgi:galactokinase